MKKLLLLVPFILLAACTPANNTDGGAAAASSAASSGQTVKVYRNISAGFDIAYPADWKITEIDNVTTPDYELSGVSFAPPVDAENTTLREAKLNVAKTGTCPMLPEPRQGFYDDYPLEMAKWNDAGAGNLYEGESYTIKAPSACYVITFFTHSCNLGPDCGPNNPQPYDKEELFAVFMNMLETFTVNE